MSRSRCGELLVEAGVFDGGGNLRCDERQSPDVLLGERADAFAFEVHDADDAVVEDEREGDLAADARIGFHVARVGERVAGQHRAPGPRGGAGQAGIERKRAKRPLFVVAAAEALLQLTAFPRRRAG